ncbi:helix-turn-helix transcriptional regulator [Gluconobacter oxydans]|uniref:Transcriptional regulator n=1 Tax=Gluconobacter oxydans NBRC 3293 TaxID=1315969 RepID=A0A829WL65_GLUOY|nr:YafY family protein [Gluconobacter oxydans]GEM17548.1 transcriptional regulator [Gluconobacter oxydans NBRC 3293]
MIAEPLRSTDRLFQIIQILRRSSRPVTARMLSEELEVSIRTIYRDVAHLMGQRVPISGEAGVGYVLGTGYDMPPLALVPAELEAIVLGVQWVAAHGEKELSCAALDVLAKVAAVVPASMQPFISVPSTAAKLPLDASQDTADRAKLRAAIRAGTKLRLHYRDQQGKLTERTVWPVVLGYSDITCMLIAWCERRQGFRHFRTDRIHAVEILDEQIGEPRSRLLQRWKAQRTSELAKATSEAG